MSAVGILDGGQLGLMLAQAAHMLGHKVVIYAAPGDNIAFREADTSIQAHYHDMIKLREFAELVGDGPITIGFENIPVETLEYLEELGAKVRPNSQALRQTQNRILEKRLATRLRIPTADFQLMEKGSGVEPVGRFRRLLPAVIKTTTGGYDGHGQWRASSDAELASVLECEGHRGLIVERFVNFAFEMSVIAARNLRGEMQFFPATVNHHEDGILRETRYKKGLIPPTVEWAARDYTTKLAEEMRYIGILAVEFFAMTNGTVRFNEIAPRVHNSGHWTLEGCKTSQFTACVRAITNAPLGDFAPWTHEARMVNILGEEANDTSALEAQGAHVHLYGKAMVRPGRKMGHATWVERVPA